MATSLLSSRLSYSIKATLTRQSRRMIQMGRVIPQIDPDLSEKIESGDVDPKRLRTRRNMGMVHLPARLQTIVENLLRDFGDKGFRAEVKGLIKIMSEFKLPDDSHSLEVKKADIRTKLEVRGKVPIPDDALEEDKKLALSNLSQLILSTLAEQRRDWHYYEYDRKAAYMYLAARLPAIYSCVKTVMREIHDTDPNFVPRSVLDFGSGMGTTYWAVNDVWPDAVSEFMNIELSSEQQHLFEYLVRSGDEMRQTPPGLFHKRYLPTSDKVKYDMIVSAFTMLELPTRESRANVIENLWHKTNDFLVIIERGNRGGFSVISEARHFVLDLCGHDVTKKLIVSPENKPIYKYGVPECHVMAPCPHEFACPRVDMTTKQNRDICRYKTMYEPLNIGTTRPGYLKEEFSYVVLRKKPHPTYIDQDCPIRWPRIVERRNKAGRQMTHKLCCPNGHLAECTVTRSRHGKSSFALAKACDWGDVLPVKVADDYVVKNSKMIRSE